MMSLGEFIRSMRKQRGMSMSDLAMAIDTSQSALSMIENDRRTPNLTTLQRLSEALGISGEELNHLKQLRNELAHGKGKETRTATRDWSSRYDPDIIMEFFEGYKTGIEIKTVGSSPTVPVNIMSALIENAIKEMLMHEKHVIRDIVKHQVINLSRQFKESDFE